MASEQWVVISGQYYLRKVVEDIVSIELQRIGCMAEGDGFDGKGVRLDPVSSGG